MAAATVGYVRLGSVSSGTMRPEDLIPAFMDALDGIREEISLPGPITESAESCQERVKEVSRIDGLLGEIERAQDASYGWEYPEDVLSELEDALSEYAPPYCYFGSHEGDGADYGYWVHWDSVEEAVREGEILRTWNNPEGHPNYWVGYSGLRHDTPLGIVADWLEEHDHDEAAELLRAFERCQYVLTGETLRDKDWSPVWQA